MLPIEQLRTRLPGIIYGGDYNPDQWSRDTWLEDVELMRRARVRLVTVGVFSWSSLEPDDGLYHFEWLDEIMDLLHDHDIAVNLSTPNASPPPWLATTSPEILAVNRDGMRMSVGGRSHFCPSSPIYRERSQRIARLLAERYRDHPALAMWHIGNEYHTQCFCDICAERFRSWLRHRHGSLDNLNEHWGTTFWSQRYSRWDQVDVPRPVFSHVNPARELDYRRFSSDLLLECFTQERDIVRQITPDIVVCTNFISFFREGDYARWAEEEDVVALDIYPNPAEPDSHVTAALNYDLMRSLRHGQPWLMMEQATSAVSQWPLNLVKQPGGMRLGSFQAIARGADAVMFFQWRASAAGQEKFHSAMLPHGGTATRTWREVEALGNELALADEVADARTPASVAILWDWENWWAVEGPGHPAHLDYTEIVTRHYAPLWRLNVAVDLVSPDSDLGRYRLVVIPNQYSISPARAKALHEYVAAGGHVIMSFFSGIVDEHDRVITGGHPGALRDLIGAHVIEFSPLPEHVLVPVHAEAGQALLPHGATRHASFWQDHLEPEGAEVVACYGGGYLVDQPAILTNTYGAGRVVYLGTRLDESSMAELLASAARDAGAAPVLETPEGVEASVRERGGTRYLFLLNHDDEERTVTIDHPGRSLLDARRYAAGERVVLEPRGVAIIAMPG